MGRGKILLPDGREILFEGSTNDVSDSFHSFGELYDHRIQLFIALCRILAHSNYKENDKFPENPVWRFMDVEDTEWFLLGIGKNKGDQITYHIPMSKWNECRFADNLFEKPEWDGHTSADVLERLKKL